MKITILGTLSMIPTKDRSTTSILLQHEGENILIDCAEATQHQLRKIDIHPSNIDKILITHWHGDHILGLPGLLQSASASVQEKEITIVGPKGTKKYTDFLLRLFKPRPTLKVNLIEFKKKIDAEKYTIDAKKMDHTALCLAYSIKEKDKRKINLEYTKKFGLIQHPLLGDLQKGKVITYQGKTITPNNATTIKKGKKISIILDTKLCNNTTIIAKDADLLICESTFSDAEKDLAENYEHLTAKQAAGIAKKAKVKQLILTHFSQRYQDLTQLEKEAKKIFKNTKILKELESISV